MKKEIQIGIVILIFALVILTIVNYINLTNNYIEIDGVNVAKIESSEDTLTLNEMAEEGISYCNTIEYSDLKDLCIHKAIMSQAKKEEDYTICDNDVSLHLVNDCKYLVISTLVALKYYEESETAGDSSIVPSNIELCDVLDNSHDIENCRNSAKMLEYKSIKYDYGLE